ncbi:phosphatidylglycerol lysyltransferase domain-containing protein [Nocardioides panaciterrulae]|uniref:Lysyl-tRNA synthetase class 2 n=1 Tax=Nocardioides panaciterrulae TaxID=661492 RepID=A0A7Y9E442_9ACTN|nr:phosphatidylglycerol lysyltransferase domain-containing protein [Nocardioides panaciterrulae]NYD40886.1 lysyl-tRNA synthetase class 2 [Nocardioides panaciterrulae]
MLARLWDTLRTPSWAARIVALVGAVTLASSLLPALRGRTEMVYRLVPDVFPAAATTGAAAVGVILLLLSRALRRGKFRAWLLATVLALVGAVLHLVKGFDFEEAMLSLALFVLLATARERFTARPDPRSTRKLVTVLLAGPVVAGGLGWIWLELDASGEAAGTSTGDRASHALLGLLGIPGPVQFVRPEQGDRAAVALVVLGAAVLFLAVLVALQPADGPHPLDEEDREPLLGLLGRWGHIDSLSYFALRDDRSVLFSPTGKAAITYQVVGTVSLAAGDPIGDPEAWPGAVTAWLDEARAFGWVPAVLAASERGAETFVRAGLDALELGDEAIVHTSEFTLEGRSMRVVRQAVSRCTRAGLVATCHRVADLDASTTELVHARAEEWRDGAVERGFSMALGRLGDPRDRDAVMVLCRDAAGTLRGMLHLVPWGGDGLSLDLMRRDRDAENGMVELMVTELVRWAAGRGVRRVSLNFAVFRSVFARGERLGAGPVLRLWRGLLLWASRFWQIESLYRANAKYRPEWRPRFVCFRSSTDLPRVGVAALRAEAFLVAPTWLRRLLPS